MNQIFFRAGCGLHGLSCLGLQYFEETTETKEKFQFFALDLCQPLLSGFFTQEGKPFRVCGDEFES